MFIDFRVIFGVSWDPLWAPVCDFSVIWGAKVGDSFQVHVFVDPGLEMMPECSGCMCYKHNKTEFFEWFHFSTYSLSWCPEGGFEVTFLCLLVTLGALFLINGGLGDRLES